MLDALVRRAEYESEREAMTPEQKAEDDARIEAFKALLPRPPAPAVPDDTRRMDWLVAHHVAVRQPLFYGSHAMFTAQQVSDDDEPHKTDLRERIDAAMLAAAPEGGNDHDTRR